MFDGGAGGKCPSVQLAGMLTGPGVAGGCSQRQGFSLRRGTQGSVPYSDFTGCGGGGE